MSEHDYLRDKMNFMTGAIVGAAAGAVIALLYAPQSGRETRAKLQKEAGRAMVDLKTNMKTFEEEQIKPAFENFKKDISKQIDEIRKEMSKKLQLSKPKATQKKK